MEDWAASRRWRRINEELRAAGCPCGRPATHVRRSVAGYAGSVPPEIWSCEEHINVNGWLHYTDGTMEPAGEFTVADIRWVGHPVRAV
jgi:hypothetical protein